MRVPVDSQGWGLTQAMASLDAAPQIGALGPGAASTLRQGDIVLVSDCKAGDIFQITSANPSGTGSLGHAAGGGSIPGNAVDELMRLNRKPGTFGNDTSGYGLDAVVYRLQTRHYYVAPSVAQPGTRSLWRYSVPCGECATNPQELAAGVERLAVTWGIDSEKDWARQPLCPRRRHRRCRRQLAAGGVGARADARRDDGQGHGAVGAHRRLRRQLGHAARPAPARRADRGGGAEEPRAMSRDAAFRSRPARGTGAGARRRQRGFSLIMSLLFMVAALVLGVSVMSVGVMQERVSGNAKDRDLAMQAAEAALRDAEQSLQLGAPPAGAFKDGCDGGLCTPPSQRSGAGLPSTLPVYHPSFGFSWSNAAKTRAYGTATGASAYPGVAQPPVYVVERLASLAAAAGVDSVAVTSQPSTGVAYRITARAVGARADTVVMLQSIYTMR